MSDTKTKSQAQDRKAIRARTEEMERKVKAEGLDLNHTEGKERFEELLKKAAKPKN
jgi:hypothetical protein